MEHQLAGGGAGIDPLLEADKIDGSLLQHRASGLNLVIAAIVFWNSTYLADAVAYLRARGEAVPDALLAHTSPLSWEHIGFSGDFLWDRAALTAGRRRPLNLVRGKAAA